MVGTPGASIRYVALPDDSALVGNAIVALQKVERCKRGRRRPRNALGDILANGNCVGCHLSNLIVNFAPLRALLADQFEAAGAINARLLRVGLEYRTMGTNLEQSMLVDAVDM